MAYEESVVDYWNYWCYFQRILRNKTTGAKTFLESGIFIPDSFGIVRSGEKKFDLNASEEIIENYLTALKPDLDKMNVQNSPISTTFLLNFLQATLNDGEVELNITIKPWANSSGSSWTTSTEITYEDILEHYIPFDVPLENYDSTLYEKTVSADLSANNVKFDDIIQTFYKFMQGNSIGFTISAKGGYCDIYGPSSNLYFLRPKFTITQIVGGRLGSNFLLDTEIKAASKVKGVCKNRSGDIITGSQCRIIVMDSDKNNLVGTGLSSAADGSFLIDIEKKVGHSVIVSFVSNDQSLLGTEIMVSVSGDTV